jgi:hypothetical protein
MKFKSLFLSFCLLFVASLSFAATNDIVPVDEDPLTIKAANEQVKEALAELPSNSDFQSMTITSIAIDDASCTVTGSIGIGGNGITVAATAETCGEALQMVLDVLNRF